MAEQTKQKCAHPACNCIPEGTGKYCSQYCEDAKGIMELSCNCGHPGCSVTKPAETIPAL